jgi:hypothetical protein
MSEIARRVCAVLLIGLLVVTTEISAPDIVAAKEKPPVAQQAPCKQSALKQTQAMIRAILNDIAKTYTRVGGGGITRIEQKATRTYVVSIAQEEGVDQITYELSVGSDCKVTILRRTPAQ